MAEADSDISKQQVQLALELVATVGQVIQELGSVPSGHLYARLMDKFDIHQYQSIIRMLVRSGMVKEKGNLLVWVG